MPRSGEDAIDETNPGGSRRDERADLGHEDDQRRLPQPAALASHVGSGKDGDATFAVIEQSVIRHELPGRQQCLQRRVSTADDFNGQRVIHDRAGKAARGSHVGERCDHVDVGDCGGGLAQYLDMRRHFGHDALQQVGFQVSQDLLGSQHPASASLSCAVT